MAANLARGPCRAGFDLDAGEPRQGDRGRLHRRRGCPRGGERLRGGDQHAAGRRVRARACWRRCRPGLVGGPACGGPGDRLLHHRRGLGPPGGEAATSRGIRFIDAPVSRAAGATAGTLTFIVGGEQADFGAARSVLACMGQNLFHAGRSGQARSPRCATTYAARHPHGGHRGRPWRSRGEGGLGPSVLHHHGQELGQQLEPGTLNGPG